MKLTVQEGFPIIEIVIKCPEITEEIQKLETLLSNCGSKLLCTQNHKKQFVDKLHIFYIESVDKRCFVYTADEVYETNSKLYELEEMLEPFGFFRNSKSQIINIGKIKSLCPDFGGRIEVEMENGERGIISRQYAKLFKERIGLK